MQKNNNTAYMLCLVTDCWCNTKDSDKNVWLQQCSSSRSREL